MKQEDKCQTIPPILFLPLSFFKIKMKCFVTVF